MKARKSWWAIGAILVVIVAAFVFVLSNSADMPAYEQPNQGANSSDQSQSSPTAPAQSPGAYVDYSAEALADAEGRRWLFFHAGWCPQCRALEQDIQNDGVPAGVTIFKVNYDSAADLKKQYGVTLQTTIVEVDDQGKLVKKYVAYNDPTLDAVTKALGD